MVERDSQALICSALAAPNGTATVGSDQRRGAGHAGTLSQRDVAIDRVCTVPRQAASGRGVISADRAQAIPSRTRRLITLTRACPVQRAIGIGKRCMNIVGQPSTRHQAAAVRAVGSLKMAASGSRGRASLIASASGSVEIDAANACPALGGEGRAAPLSYR